MQFRGITAPARWTFLPIWTRAQYARAVRRAAMLFPGPYPTDIPGLGAMLLSPGDFIDSRIACFHVWEPEITAFIKAHLKPDRVAVDIGANIGYFTIVMSRVARQVYAVEPCPPTLEKLDWTVKHNGLSNVQVLPYGISDRAERRAMTYDRHNSGRNAFAEPAADGIELRRFEDLIPAEDLPDVSLIKIDVEGMEGPVMRDIASVVPKMAPDLVIVCEAWSDGTPLDWLPLYLEQGFRPFRIPNSYGFDHYARATIADPAPYVDGHEGIHDIALIRA
ncbi:FkbM family methyltransferase [Sphingomonas tabacisoli]|uniref:FkbM family methyltransferase n=1 Tax=Sphingomonas tabacisoli TaxID=2249466 RepID=A0ABW4I117_9SPHN